MESEMYYQAAHMNIHTQNTSSIKKKKNMQVGVFLIGWVL